MYWTGEGTHFEGTIAAEKEEGGETVHEIDYDDGETKTHNLSKERWVKIDSAGVALADASLREVIAQKHQIRHATKEKLSRIRNDEKYTMQTSMRNFAWAAEYGDDYTVLD